MTERIQRVQARIRQIFNEEYPEEIPADEAIYVLSTLIADISMPETMPESSPKPITAEIVEITSAQQAVIKEMKAQPVIEINPGEDFLKGFNAAIGSMEDQAYEPPKMSYKPARKGKAKSVAVEQGEFDTNDLF